jgi:hypothetical protein
MQVSLRATISSDKCAARCAVHGHGIDRPCHNNRGHLVIGQVNTKTGIIESRPVPRLSVFEVVNATRRVQSHNPAQTYCLQWNHYFA